MYFTHSIQYLLLKYISKIQSINQSIGITLIYNFQKICDIKSFKNQFLIILDGKNTGLPNIHHGRLVISISSIYKLSMNINISMIRSFLYFPKFKLFKILQKKNPVAGQDLVAAQYHQKSKIYFNATSFFLTFSLSLIKFKKKCHVQLFHFLNWPKKGAWT